MFLTNPAAILLTITMVGVLVGGASAAIKTKVAISQAYLNSSGGVSMNGAVRVPKHGGVSREEAAACKRARKVSLYEDKNPEGPSESDVLLGKVTTNRSGRWSFGNTTDKPARVYARVSAKVRNPGENCGSARSGSKSVATTPP